jgi:retron-type reverse transcriptase
MGKSYRHLWPQMTSLPNLLLAFHKARRGKRSQPAVAAFEFELEANLFQLQDELRRGVYQPGGYASFRIHDPKRRLISAAPFRDRVVHHALVNVLEPIFERMFIFDTYANRRGKGTHRALDRCTHFLRRHTYLLPLDIRQYFPSIDHAILLSILGRTIADEQALDLCARILAGGQGVLVGEYQMVYFPGDDLLAGLRPRGLPIGNLTSQFWANVYLNPLDHFIKRQLKCPGYVRYVDDMLLFADQAATLHTWRSEVIDFLAGLRLTVHELRAQPRPCACGVPFLGFQVFPDHRRLKRQKAVLARRRIKAIAGDYQQGRASQEQVRTRLVAWLNHARYGDTWGLRRSVLSEVSFPAHPGGQLDPISIPNIHEDL